MHYLSFGESVPATTVGNQTAVADVFGQLLHNHGHNLLKSGQDEEQQDICTILPDRLLDRHTVVLITPGHGLFIQLVFYIRVQPGVVIRNESTRTVWQLLSHIPAIIVDILRHHAVSSDYPAGKLEQHGDKEGQSQVSTQIEQLQQAHLKHWQYMLTAEDTDTYLVPVHSFRDGTGTVKDTRHDDKFQTGRHQSHSIDEDVRLSQTHAGPVQAHGQVLSQEQNTCEIQVMSHNSTFTSNPPIVQTALSMAI